MVIVFEILVEFGRLNLLFLAGSLPLLLIGFWGLARQKDWALFLFVGCLVLGSFVWDLRVMVTAQVFLLKGFVFVLRRHKFVWLVCLFPVIVFLCWWVSEKLFYFGLA